MILLIVLENIQNIGALGPRVMYVFRYVAHIRNPS